MSGKEKAVSKIQPKMPWDKVVARADVRAMVEAYLRGDIWIVLFWEEDASAKDSRALDVHRFRVSVDAVTGDAKGFSRG